MEAFHLPLIRYELVTSQALSDEHGTQKVR